MRRPGPLKELPLEHFLPNNAQSNIINSTPNKRPVSPDPFPLTPAKRRILNEELFFFSPERTPRSSPYGRKVPRIALDGPGSPSRKLHFGLPEPPIASIASPPPDPPLHSIKAGESGSSTAPSSSASRKLAPSPELKMKTRSSHRRAAATQNDDIAQRTAHVHPSTSDALPVTIARDIPSLPDRHSVHHPGFDIYQDPHIFLSYGFRPSVPDAGKDAQKENAPARKKSHKIEPATPSADKGLDIFPKIPSMPLTPRKKHVTLDDSKRNDGPSSPTPRRPATRLLRTPVSTPLLSKTDRRERKRKMLEVEVDGGEDDDDDNADLLF